MPSKPAARQPRSAVLQVRLTAQERKLLERAASAEHLPLGTWLRQAGLREAERASSTRL